MKVVLKISEDGSSTLYRPDLDEHYHSMHGAIRESMHVFIESGLKQTSANPLHILEIGFGTGLNALLSIIHQPPVMVHYHSIEKYPVDLKLVEQFNYPFLLKDQNAENFFQMIHKVPWNQESKIDNHFILKKILADLQQFEADNVYDLVYFDAFAPEKQPELWTEEIFHKIYKSMRLGGILSTYCSKGVVRRRMQTAGFKVERLPGPPGKREILKATKPLQ